MEKHLIKKRFANLKVWKSGGQRAPHKPLLLLYALGRCQQQNERLMPYSEVEKNLKKLLMDFGPSRKIYHPEYPFWHLKSEGLWELHNAENVQPRKSNNNPSKKELLKHDVSGGLTKEVYQTVLQDKAFFGELTYSLLESSFPASMHDDILQAVGISLKEKQPDKSRIRDSQFRERTLRAYEYQCAVCGFNIRLGHSLIALEAAHIKWHQAGGPDLENNGIALCALHHKLFDRGAFTITNNMDVKVSEMAHGTQGFNEWLMAYHGKKIRPPQRPSFYPEPKYVSWHVKEVFKGFARHI